MKSPVTYYYDKSHTKRVAVNETGQPILDWGETIPGQRKEKTLYIKNESRDTLVLRQPFTTGTALKIEDYPTRMFSEEKSTIKFSLTPDVDKIESDHSTWGLEIVAGQ